MRVPPLRYAPVGMTKWRVVAHLCICGDGLTKLPQQQPTQFRLPAFSSTHSASCAFQEAIPSGLNQDMFSSHADPVGPSPPKYARFLFLLTYFLAASCALGVVSVFRSPRTNWVAAKSNCSILASS